MKLLFAIFNLQVGGIEKSLVNLCNELSDNHRVDIVLLNGEGPLISNLKKEVNVIKLNKGISKYFDNKKRSKIRVFNFLNYKKNFFLQRLKMKKCNIFNDEYDVAIACNILTPNSVYFVTNIIKAKKKIGFIHCDVKHWDIPTSVINDIKKLDTICTVSQSSLQSINRKYPNLKNTNWCYNLQNEEEIIVKSKEKIIDFEEDKINLVHVARLSFEKGHLRFLKVLQKLKNDGYNFCYHIVGDGDEREKIIESINKYELNDCVCFHGQQLNPYPYMKNADINILVSFNECCPLIYTESFILKKPIFSTETCSSNEIINNLGWICENSEDGIYNELKKIFNKKAIDKVNKNLSTYKYQKEDIINKFISICKE